MAEPVEQRPSPTDWATQVRDTLAAIAGAAAVIYVTGGLIVGLRLYVAGLPTASVVGQLPRNVLLSLGLSQGLFPALFIAAIYAAMRSLIHRDATASATRLKKKTWAAASGWQGYLLYISRTLACAAVVIAPALASAIWDRSAGSSETRLAIVLGPLAVISWLGTLLYPNLRGEIAGRFTNEFRGRPATVLHSLLLVLVLVPGCVAYWGTKLPDEATVCMTPSSTEMQTELHGYLVGQTTDDAFIGGLTGLHRKVTSVPTAQIRRVVVGPDAATPAACSG